MSVEIRELIIRVAVESEAESASEPPLDREALIADCVAQVMEILAEKEAR